MQMITIENFISEEQCEKLLKQIGKVSFESGLKTAGLMAINVKRNLQLDLVGAKKITDEVRNWIATDPRVVEAAFPKQVGTVLINRYDVDMEYGVHTDAAFMNGIRNDLSFTLFLSKPSDYEGGELVLHYPHQMVSYKPAKGSVVFYPTGVMHKVEKVTRGSRVACVGWIESQIRHEAQREILRELMFVQKNYFGRCGHDFLAELFLKNIANLHRHWGE
jgi:PKHD-type hydroxylase